jgi:hypothetical protein
LRKSPKPPMRSRAALLRRDVSHKVQELRVRQVPLYVIFLRACRGAWSRLMSRMWARKPVAVLWLSALRKLFKGTLSHSQRFAQQAGEPSLYPSAISRSAHDVC